MPEIDQIKEKIEDIKKLFEVILKVADDIAKNKKIDEDYARTLVEKDDKLVEKEKVALKREANLDEQEDFLIEKSNSLTKKETDLKTREDKVNAFDIPGATKQLEDLETKKIEVKKLLTQADDLKKGQEQLKSDREILETEKSKLRVKQKSQEKEKLWIKSEKTRLQKIAESQRG